ncbi:phosphoenolpyruvate synthase [Aspergillus tetrazonus]
MHSKTLVADFQYIRRDDCASVGGENASLGEMISTLAPRGIAVPPGFAVTSHGYWEFVQANCIRENIARLISVWQSGRATLAETGESIRKRFLLGSWPPEVEDAIQSAYRNLAARAGVDSVSFAVRSSATAEDLPDASSAGQLDSFLNIEGEEAVLLVCRRCYASFFTDRAISYRQTMGFDHAKIALSVGMQKMVRSDASRSGVMFSIDTESGFDKVIVINTTWGLGENIMQGTVNPAMKMVYVGRDPSRQSPHHEPTTRNMPTSKAERAAFVLTDKEILQLARWACTIKRHYGCPMDMEWAKNRLTNKLFIVQARPETVHSRQDAAAFKTYGIIRKKGRELAKGLSIRAAAVSGRICLIEDAKDIDQFVDGSILVTKATDPDWVPIMKHAAAIVTDHGGHTSHAAIISRELGLPAVVAQDVTVSCAEGDNGFIYEGCSSIQTETIDLTNLPESPTKVILNMANPAAAYRWWRLPADGIGRARMEFVVTNAIQVHSMALVHFEKLKDENAKAQVARLTARYIDKPAYFVDKLAHGFAALCAAAYLRPAILRDFKTNEYADLIGGREFEPKEENPMLGFRGASRYYSPHYKEAFGLEYRAIKYLRETIGFSNAIVMIPFCRTVGEAQRVLGVMSENGLVCGQHGLQVYMMCEIPSNVIHAADFAEYFDGFSIGSNYLTQLTLGVDRDSEQLADLFSKQDKAVKWMIAEVIDACRKKGCKIGICRQAPSDHPGFARFLAKLHIDSISVSPDSFVAVKRNVCLS